MATSGLPLPLVLAVPVAGTLWSALLFFTSLASARRDGLAPRDAAARLVLCCGAAMPFAPGIAALSLGPTAAALCFLAGAPQLLASSAGSLVAASAAGAPFPHRYRHDDGGIYDGEWEGGDKEGRGVYRYPSGAVYEGEWRNGRKEGRGCHRWASGGTYEGEWRAGAPCGVGVRRYASGRTEAGRFLGGKLEEPMEGWQCAPAAAGAREAAAAARRVAAATGGLRPAELLGAAARVTPSIAVLLAIAAIAAGYPLPRFLLKGLGAAGGGALATVYASLGAGLASASGGFESAIDARGGRSLVLAAPALAVRHGLGGLAAAALAVAAAVTGGAAAAGGGQPALVATLLALGLLCLAPASPLPGGPQKAARRFRLDEEEVAAGSAVSQVLGATSLILYAAGGRVTLAVAAEATAVAAVGSNAAGVLATGSGSVCLWAWIPAMVALVASAAGYAVGPWARSRVRAAQGGAGAGGVGAGPRDPPPAGRAPPAPAAAAIAVPSRERARSTVVVPPRPVMRPVVSVATWRSVAVRQGVTLVPRSRVGAPALSGAR